MANSTVEIVNVALVLIGEDTIVSFGDATTRARLAALQYDIVRRQLLREFRWSFATKRAILAPEAEAPAFGFTYKFLLPVDCLRFIGLFDGNQSDSQINYTGADTAFKIEGRYVLSDDTTLYAFYTADIENPAEMDASFSQALSFALAKMLAIPLTNDTDKFKIASSLYAEAIRSAKAMSAIENSPEILMASDWVESRYNGISGGRKSLIGF